MSTNPQPTTEPKPNTIRTTEIEARGQTDPWAAPNETVNGPAGSVQRQFEPTSCNRIRNLFDEENAYCQ